MNTSEIVDSVEMDRFWTGYSWLRAVKRDVSCALLHSASVLSSRNAASATFALNSALNTRRVRRVDDLLIIISRQGLSRPGKKPSMALIEPVQFCRATSFPVVARFIFL